MSLCAKCETSCNGGGVVYEHGLTYPLCALCMRLYDNLDRTGIISDFLRDDFPLLQPTKNIIEARKNRAEGKSPWKK